MALTQVSRGLLSTSIVDNGNATAITIDSSENVGIGTSSPAEPLHVQEGSSGITSKAGTIILVDGSGNSKLSIASGTTSTGELLFGSSADNDAGRIIYDHSDDGLQLWTNGSRAVDIDSSGNLGIGISNPAYKLVVSNGGNGGLEFGPDGIAAGTSFIQAYDRAASQYDALRLYSSHYQFFIGAGTRALDIDTAGNVLVGTTDAAVGVGNTNTGLSLRSDGFAALSRTGTSGQPTLVVNKNTNDGELVGFYKSGVAVGTIGTVSDGLFIAGNSTENTGIRFYTVGVAPCTNAGAYIDNARDLGSASVRWDDVYATNGTIQTSDRNEKQDIAELSDAEQRVAVAAKGLLRKFRWKSSVEENGDDARIHFGIIAQDLQDAFTAEGLDAGRYAMFISSTWTDEETGEERTRLGVRYSELLAFIISAI